MPTSTYPAMGGAVDNTSAATFIPEHWSDEIRAEYEKSLVCANHVKKIDFVGKKGDTLHIPAPVRGTAHAKAENTAVTIQQDTESEVVVNIDKHYEYSRLIEDITDTQALATLRPFYTQDAGYQLAKQVDSDLITLWTGLGDGTYAAAPAADGTDHVNSATFYNDASSGMSAYAIDTVVTADVFEDDALRFLIKELDDNDVPMDGRIFVIPPTLRSAIMGIDRYVSSDFTPHGTVANGFIGSLYGVDVYVSTNCPVIETSANNAVSSVNTRGACLFHPEAFILAEQMGIRSQTQYKQEFLANLYTADRLYGIKNYRTEAGVVLAVPEV